MYNVAQTIYCPICQDDYTHFDSPVVLKGNDNYETGYKFRGDVIQIKMNCESGHAFNLNIGFHKGSSFLWFEPLDEPATLRGQVYEK